MQLCGRYWGLVCVAAAVTLSTAFAAGEFYEPRWVNVAMCSAGFCG